MIKILAVLAVVIGAASASGMFCSICEAGVQEIINVADGDQGKAKQILEGECKKFLHHSWEVDACDFAVDEAVTEIMKLINQHLSAQQVCDTIHLCSGMPGKQARLAENQYCATCDKAVAMLINAVNNNNLDNEVDAICKKFGVEARCQQVIAILKNLVDQIGKDPAAVCAKFLPFCKASAHQQTLVATTKGGPFCAYCEAGIGAIENLLKNYVPSIVNDIKSLCSKLPGSEADLCANLVDQYLGTIIDKLLGMLNADKICTGIKLCTAGSTEPAIDMAQLTGAGVNWDPVECNFCKMTFAFIQQNFMSQEFENALLMDLAKGCKAIDNTQYQKECMDILATYGDMILNYAKSLIAPDHICPMIKMCPKPTIAPSVA